MRRITSPDIMWQYIITPRKENATAVTEIAGNLSQVALRTAVSKSFHVAINDRRVVDGVGICLQHAEVRELYTRLAKHQANQQLLEEHFALAMQQDGFGGLAPGPGGLVPVPSTPNVVVAFWDNMGSDAELRVPENFVQGLSTQLSRILMFLFHIDHRSKCQNDNMTKIQRAQITIAQNVRMSNVKTSKCQNVMSKGQMPKCQNVNM